ncbi:MAG: zf-HC2 domain-containing protein [Gammaproteobacteria bacterium]
MADSTCDMLDEYLDGSLAELHHERFAAHLEHCSACTAEVELQQSIEKLLAAGDASCAPPSELVIRIERATHRAALKRWITASLTLLVAALFVFGITHLLYQPQQAELPRSPTTVDQTPQSRVERTVRLTAVLKPVVTVETSRNAIAVEVPTDSPHVYVFRIFPTFNTNHSPQTK